MAKRRNKRDPKAIQKVGAWMYEHDTPTASAATIGQYADYFSMSDVAMQAAMDGVVADAAKELSNQMAKSLEFLVNATKDDEVIEIGGSTDWAKSSLITPTATNQSKGSVLTKEMIKKAHEELKKKSLKPDKDGNITYLIPHQKIQLFQYNLAGCAKKLAEVTVDSEGVIC